MSLICSYKGIVFKFGEGVYVDSSVVFVGDIELGDDVSIWFLVVVWGDVNYIWIGKCINI